MKMESGVREKRQRPQSSPSSFFVGFQSFDGKISTNNSTKNSTPLWMNRDRSLMILGLNSRSKKAISGMDANQATIQFIFLHP
jgi:hypothetical protein